MFVNRVLPTAARHIALSYSKILPCRYVLIRLSLYRSGSPFTFLPWFRAVSLVYPLFTCRISDALQNGGVLIGRRISPTTHLKSKLVHSEAAERQLYDDND